MNAGLDHSYAYCREVARSRARNFYYSFLLLNTAKRDAMCAIYAFMRYCDDLSDEPGSATAETMERWRADLDRALAGSYAGHAVWPAFHETVMRYKIPHRYFHSMIDGVSSDLTPRRLATFEELYEYCYQVASVVGLTIVHIFGFRDPAALDLAEKCGVAFQLTNILRDVKEDAGMGRVYLPAEDLARFRVDPAGFRHTTEFIELMRFEAARARRYYEESAPLVGMVEPESRASLRALIGIYSRLLDRIEAANFNVLSRRISLSAAEKLWILVRAWLRLL